MITEPGEDARSLGARGHARRPRRRGLRRLRRVRHLRGEGRRRPPRRAVRDAGRRLAARRARRADAALALGEDGDAAVAIDKPAHGRAPARRPPGRGRRVRATSSPLSPAGAGAFGPSAGDRRRRATCSRPGRGAGDPLGGPPARAGRRPRPSRPRRRSARGAGAARAPRRRRVTAPAAGPEVITSPVFSALGVQGQAARAALHARRRPPARAKAQLRCRGRKCPFRARTRSRGREGKGTAARSSAVTAHRAGARRPRTAVPGGAAGAAADHRARRRGPGRALQAQGRARAAREAGVPASGCAHSGGLPAVASVGHGLALLPPQPPHREVPDLLAGARGRAARPRRRRARRPCASAPAGRAAARARGSPAAQRRRRHPPARPRGGRRLPQPARPGPAGDRRRRAARRARCSRRQERLEPPGPYEAVATEPDREQATWLAFLLTLVGPDAPRRTRSPRPRRAGRTACRRTCPRPSARRRGLPPVGGARRLAGRRLHGRGRLVAAAAASRACFERLALPGFTRAHALRPARRARRRRAVRARGGHARARRRRRRRDAGRQAGAAVGRPDAARAARARPRARRRRAARRARPRPRLVGRPRAWSSSRPRSGPPRCAPRSRCVTSESGAAPLKLVLACLALAALAHFLPAAPDVRPVGVDHLGPRDRPPGPRHAHRAVVEAAARAVHDAVRARRRPLGAGAVAGDRAGRRAARVRLHVPARAPARRAGRPA